LSSEIEALVEQSAAMPGLYDVYVRNRGSVDAMVPERVTITSSSGVCESADAIGPYAMEKSGKAIEFRRVTPRLLAKSGQTLIGWVRCAPVATQGEIRVDVRS
jgi:hypothetical protein